MNSFISNKIFFDAETIAEQLRSARQELGLKLTKVAKDIGINIKYLEALETGRFELLPAGVYGKNFLREYAMFLRLDYRPLLKMFENEAALVRTTNQQELFAKQKVRARNFLMMPKLVKNLIILGLVTICLVFLVFRLEKIVSPPMLEIFTPTDNFITKDHQIIISGRSETEIQLLINDQPVVIDTAGKFTKTIDLKRGINIISIMAQKKYGRSNTIKRQILAEF